MDTHDFLKKLGYLSVAEYCQIRGISPHTAANERCSNQGPRYIKKGRLILYPEDAITEYLESGVVVKDYKRNRRHNG